MPTFEFFSVPRIVFGCGSLARIGGLAVELGRSAMIISNAGEPGDGSVHRLIALLQDAGRQWAFWKQPGEPTVEDVCQALDVARREACDLVIGLGGGSALDCAKAVAGLLANGGLPLDYLEVVGRGQKLAKPAIPWIAVPTTAGTGAEVTRNAVIGCPGQQFKASLRSPHLLATIALVDPELAASVPRQVAACSGMDALCQLVESYTSNQAQPVTDALALQGMALAARSLPDVVKDEVELHVRDDLALAALLSGMTLANVGLGAVHGFAAPLGACLPIPHGTVCAALLPHVMAANVEAALAQSPEHPALVRYATIGRTLTGDCGLPDTLAIDAGIQWVAELTERLGIPRLGQFGLFPEHISQLVTLARKASSMRYNPVVLSDETLAQILRNAL